VGYWVNIKTKTCLQKRFFCSECRVLGQYQKNKHVFKNEFFVLNVGFGSISKKKNVFSKTQGEVMVNICVYMCVQKRIFCSECRLLGQYQKKKLYSKTQGEVMVNICVCMCVNTCKCVYTCVNVCTCVYMCVHVCTCVYMCVKNEEKKNVYMCVHVICV